MNRKTLLTVSVLVAALIGGAVQAYTQNCPTIGFGDNQYCLWGESCVPAPGYGFQCALEYCHQPWYCTPQQRQNHENVECAFLACYNYFQANCKACG